MALVFITGNEGKFKEVEMMLGVPLERRAIDLPEIQSLDAYEVMRAKIEAACTVVSEPFIIEDTSLYLSCLKDALPGPFIKWFERSLGNEGMVALAQKCGDDGARALTLFGYYGRECGEHIFDGSLRGRIVPARGDQDFGWGPIFESEGIDKTFGEMTREEKCRESMRAFAAQKLKNFLRSQK